MLNCYCQLSSSVIFRQYGVSQSECKIDRPRPGLPRVSPRPHTETLGTRLTTYYCQDDYLWETKSVDIQSLKRDLVSSNLWNDLVDGQTDSTVNGLILLVQSYNETLSEIINRYSNFISRTMSVRPAVPWYDDNIKAAKRKSIKAERM
jgi:hypothetical protein